MDQELRKQYNKQYYQNHKEALLQKLTSKVNCEFCNREVSFGNLNKHYNIHRLVAMAFIPNIENKKCVDHIDSNKLNNTFQFALVYFSRK